MKGRKIAHYNIRRVFLNVFSNENKLGRKYFSYSLSKISPTTKQFYQINLFKKELEYIPKLLSKLWKDLKNNKLTHITKPIIPPVTKETFKPKFNMEEMQRKANEKRRMQAEANEERENRKYDTY
jgi:hypothetical protein